MEFGDIPPAQTLLRGVDGRTFSERIRVLLPALTPISAVRDSDGNRAMPAAPLVVRSIPLLLGSRRPLVKEPTEVPPASGSQTPAE